MIDDEMTVHETINKKSGAGDRYMGLMGAQNRTHTS